MSNLGTAVLALVVAGVGVLALALALSAGSTVFAIQMAIAVLWAASFLVFILKRAKS